MHVGLLSALLATVLSVAETQRFADADYNGRVFDLSGRVVYLPGQQSIILDDGTGRTVVYGLSEELAQSLTPGSRVTVRVQTIVNDNGKNCLWCRGLAVHAPGDGQVTVDDDVRAADIFQGRHDLRFVRFDGILTDFHEDEIEAGNLILFLYADGEIVPVYTDLREPLRSRRNELLGSHLRVTGLVMPSAGGWRTFQGRMIAVCGAASRIDVRPPSPSDPFDAPRLEKLHHLDPREIAHLPQLSAAGRVAALGRDGVFFVQTGNRRHGKTIAAALAEGEPLPPIGEDVRLVGFPETDLFNISLRSVRWRAEPLSEALPVNEPVAVTAGELFSDANGRPRIGANLHGRLVTIQGLVRALPTAPADTLRLACDGSDIIVDARPLGPAAETLALGSRVALTGLCILETDVWAPNRPFPKDLMMPVLNGAEATARIAAAAPHAKVLILTSYGSADDIGRTLDAGARGAVIKTISNEALADAIRKVADGQVCVDPEISKMLKSEPPVPELTERQRDILLSAARGLTNEEIARQFGITASAVKQHLSSVFAKLGVANRAEAVSYALRKQLLKA